VRNGNTSQPMQHVDLCRLLGRIRRAVWVAVRLEEPIFGRSFDPQPGGRQGVGSQLDIGFSDHKIDIVAWLGAASYPEGITTAQREGDAACFQG
jgi:hypothetical protein